MRGWPRSSRRASSTRSWRTSRTPGWPATRPSNPWRRTGPRTSPTCWRGSPRRGDSWRRPSVPEPPPEADRAPFAYAIVRVVPHVERGERLNAGIVLLCRPRRFLGAEMRLDEARLRSLCLLYTSDAADDLTRVDLGGSRLLHKK